MSSAIINSIRHAGIILYHLVGAYIHFMPVGNLLICICKVTLLNLPEITGFA